MPCTLDTSLSRWQLPISTARLIVHYWKHQDSVLEEIRYHSDTREGHQRRTSDHSSFCVDLAGGSTDWSSPLVWRMRSKRQKRKVQAEGERTFQSSNEVIVEKEIIWKILEMRRSSRQMKCGDDWWRDFLQKESAMPLRGPLMKCFVLSQVLVSDCHLLACWDCSVPV